jgi:hypothetical protein
MIAAREETREKAGRKTMFTVPLFQERVKSTPKRISSFLS